MKLAYVCAALLMWSVSAEAMMDNNAMLDGWDEMPGMEKRLAAMDFRRVRRVPIRERLRFKRGGGFGPKQDRFS